VLSLSHESSAEAIAPGSPAAAFNRASPGWDMGQMLGAPGKNGPGLEHRSGNTNLLGLLMSPALRRASGILPVIAVDLCFVVDWGHWDAPNPP
jgi:hypothetical protein